MPKTSFGGASHELLRVVREQIRAGSASERGLAKLAGVSQPHMHNVLSGKRGLASGVADRLLAVLGISLEDLLSERDRPAAEIGASWLESPIGGGRAFPRIATGRPERFFDPARLKRFQAPCLGRIANEETAMLPTLYPGDDVLLDFDWPTRRKPRKEAIYLIEWQGRSYLRRCHAVAGAVIIVSESPSRASTPPRIALDARAVPDIVRAEVVWFGRMLART